LRPAERGRILAPAPHESIPHPTFRLGISKNGKLAKNGEEEKKSNAGRDFLPFL